MRVYESLHVFRGLSESGFAGFCWICGMVVTEVEVGLMHERV